MIQIPYHQMSAAEAQELTVHLQRDPDWYQMSDNVKLLALMTMLYNLPLCEMATEYIDLSQGDWYSIKYMRSTWKTKVFRPGEEEAATEDVMRQMTAGVAKASKLESQYDTPVFDVNDIHFAKD